MNYVSWKQRKEVATDLRTIYTAPTAEAAELALDQFAAKWDKSYAALSQIWRRNSRRHHSVLPVPGGDPQGHLHDQRDREFEYGVAQDHQDARVLSERGGGYQVAVSGTA